MICLVFAAVREGQSRVQVRQAPACFCLSLFGLTGSVGPGPFSLTSGVPSVECFAIPGGGGGRVRGGVGA